MLLKWGDSEKKSCTHRQLCVRWWKGEKKKKEGDFCRTARISGRLQIFLYDLRFHPAGKAPTPKYFNPYIFRSPCKFSIWLARSKKKRHNEFLFKKKSPRGIVQEWMFLSTKKAWESPFVKEMLSGNISLLSWCVWFRSRLTARFHSASCIAASSVRKMEVQVALTATHYSTRVLSVTVLPILL